MREIKYKVYDKNKNKIFKVIRLCKSFEGDCEVDYCYYQNEKNDLEWLPLTEGILMQSTGIKDKNGIEIYEGDIVQYKKGKVGVVEYEELEGLYHVNKDPLQYYVHDTITDNPSTDLEVIGNIHDNPELLKEVN